ncbi:MAG: EutN/CcmL family microcompartment protein, partial [Clostridia bacterium]
MMIGKVVGSVVATRKNDSLVGCKLLIVEPLA